MVACSLTVPSMCFCSSIGWVLRVDQIRQLSDLKIFPRLRSGWRRLRRHHETKRWALTATEPDALTERSGKLIRIGAGSLLTRRRQTHLVCSLDVPAPWEGRKTWARGSLKDHGKCRCFATTSRVPACMSSGCACWNRPSLIARIHDFDLQRLRRCVGRRQQRELNFQLRAGGRCRIRARP